jgi:hypothetical protein
VKPATTAPKRGLLHQVREHDAASWPMASRWAALCQRAAASALANGTR